MPKQPSKKPTLKCRFDYEALDKIIKAAGGIESVSQAAGTTRAGYSLLRKNQKIPISNPILAIFTHLNLSAAQIRNLFIKTS